MNAPFTGEIGMAVTEAQAVLQLVADKLRTSDPLDAHEAFTLFAAVTVAIERLDVVHEVLHAADEPLVALAPGAIQ